MSINISYLSVPPDLAGSGRCLADVRPRLGLVLPPTQPRPRRRSRRTGKSGCFFLLHVPIGILMLMLGSDCRTWSSSFATARTCAGSAASSSTLWSCESTRSACVSTCGTASQTRDDSRGSERGCESSINEVPHL